MAYLSGDGDLEQTAEGYLSRLVQTGATPQVHMVAQIDGGPGAGDTRRVLIGGPGQVAQTWMLGEVDMGSVRAVADFVTWARRTFPARRYALLMIGHGTGVIDLAGEGTSAAAILRGFGVDESAGDYLSVRELGEALSAAREDGRPGLDVVCLDACLTGAIEIAYELRDSARYLTCVEGALYHPGAPCERALSSLSRSPDMTPREFAAEYVREMGAYWKKGEDVSVVGCAVDLSRIGTLAGALDDLAEALMADMPDAAVAVTRARARARAFGDGQQYRDIGSFATALAEESDGLPIVKAALAVKRALSDAVVATTAPAGCPLGPSGGAGGMCAFFPPNLSRFPTEYSESSAFAAQTRWGAFLEAYLQHMRGLFEAGTA